MDIRTGGARWNKSGRSKGKLLWSLGTERKTSCDARPQRRRTGYLGNPRSGRERRRSGHFRSKVLVWVNAAILCRHYTVGRVHKAIRR